MRRGKQESKRKYGFKLERVIRYFTQKRMLKNVDSGKRYINSLLYSLTYSKTDLAPLGQLTNFPESLSVNKELIPRPYSQRLRLAIKVIGT